LPLHVRDEEESTLPRLRAHSPEVDRALDRMDAEHDEHGPKLAALLRACAAVRGAPHERALRVALLEVARELEQDFQAHLELEETVLFPAIRASLSADVQAEIVRELRARRSA
jgi:iron-sulfur cluster repair protein YtfE (RIC family)